VWPVSEHFSRFLNGAIIVHKKCNTVRVSLNINFYLEKLNANNRSYQWNDVSCCSAHVTPLYFCGFSEGGNSLLLTFAFAFSLADIFVLLISFLFFNQVEDFALCPEK